MKSLHLFIVRNLVVAGSIYFMAGCAATKNNETGKTTVNIKDQLNKKSWAFVAQSASPMSGRTIQLNGYNELVVKNDSIRSYLPYYGRAYSAPINPSEGGYDFAARLKTYVITNHNNNEYYVELTPLDRSNAEKFNLSVFDNGTAVLTVTNNNRQPISFKGYLKETK